MLVLGYIPDLNARGMVQRRTGIVAAFVPTLTDSIYASVIQGLSDTIATGGMHLMLGNTQYSLEEEERLVLAMLGRRPDALVLTEPNHTARLRKTLIAVKIPIVEMWEFADDPIDMIVGFSNRAVGYVLTRHLLDRGYRRIGYVGRPAQPYGRAARRRQGYYTAMAEAGIEVSPEWILESATSLATGERAVDVLACNAGVQAIVFSSDVAAIGALLACLTRGIRVPEQLAVCGLGDLELASRVPPGLTTLRIDGHYLGQTAGTMLLSALRNDPLKSRSQQVDFHLIQRGST